MSQIVISSWKDGIPGWEGQRKLPLAFTEKDEAILSGILRNEKTVNVNNVFMQAFVKMHELIDENKDLKKKLDEMEN